MHRPFHLSSSSSLSLSSSSSSSSSPSSSGSSFKGSTGRASRQDPSRTDGSLFFSRHFRNYKLNFGLLRGSRPSRLLSSSFFLSSFLLPSFLSFSSFFFSSFSFLFLLLFLLSSRQKRPVSPFKGRSFYSPMKKRKKRERREKKGRLLIIHYIQR